MKSYFSHLILLSKRLGLAFFIFTCCRVLFYLFNSSHFSEVSLSVFFYGIRFDGVSVAYLFSPFILCSIIPFSFRDFRRYQRFLAILFYTGNTLGIILNLVDVAYFDFTFKRTTTDLFSMIGAAGGKDFTNLLHLYIIDFWYDYILLIGLLFFSWFIYKKYCRFNGNFRPYVKKDYIVHSFIFIGVIAITVIGARGGLQYKPLTTINGGQYAKIQNIPIVLNTPFTILKTLFKDNIEPINYYNEEELKTIYDPTTIIKGNPRFEGKNVVLIILESLAKEYVYGFKAIPSYTPFIDSLMKESYVFNKAYANGQKSIEALPSILASVPSLMNTPFVASNYSGNRLDGLPKYLKKEGYNTSFYHGGENGTMGFDGFTSFTGIDDYFGLNEYDNKKEDYDGVWGIFDEPYLQYYAQEMNTKPEPFFSAVFTISSHHPYTIPDKHIGRFPKGSLPLHETVGYMDYSLKQFFETAKKMPWFQNTLFVFTADHSAISYTNYYRNLLGRFEIPMFIFDPSGSLKGENNDLFQQIDISPTILGLVTEKQEIISFGNNAFDQSEKFSVNYAGSLYQLYSNDYLLIFDGQKSLNLFNTKNDPLLKINLIDSPAELTIKNKLESKLKGIIQQYNNRLINNTLSLD